MILARLNHVGVVTLSSGNCVALNRDVMGATTIGAAFDLTAPIAADSSSHYNVM